MEQIIKLLAKELEKPEKYIENVCVCYRFYNFLRLFWEETCSFEKIVVPLQPTLKLFARHELEVYGYYG